MPVDTIIKNIEDVEAKAIVNSLGVGKGIQYFGQVCSAIDKKANNPEFTERIRNAKHIYSLGEFFVTKGYYLHAKNIINLLTPCYKDDPDLSILQDCVRRILYECTRNAGQYTSIAIPLLGTGANGYPAKKVYDMLLKISEKFINGFTDKYTVVIVLSKEAAADIFDKKTESDDLPSERIIGSIKTEFKKETQKYKKTHIIPKDNKNDRDYFKNDSIDSKRQPILPLQFEIKPTSVDEYIKQYNKARYTNDSNSFFKIASYERVKAFLGYGNQDPKTAGKKVLDQLVLASNINRFYAVAFGLKMNEDEAKAFLNYFGKSFPSPAIAPETEIVLKLFAENIYDFYSIKEKINIFS